MQSKSRSSTSWYTADSQARRSYSTVATSATCFLSKPRFLSLGYRIYAETLPSSHHSQAVSEKISSYIWMFRNTIRDSHFVFLSAFSLGLRPSVKKLYYHNGMLSPRPRYWGSLLLLSTQHCIHLAAPRRQTYSVAEACGAVLCAHNHMERSVFNEGAEFAASCFFCLYWKYSFRIGTIYL